MNRHKKKLIVLLVVGVVVIALYKITDSLNVLPNGPEATPPFGWHWWSAMMYWIYFIGWVLSFKCAQCKKPQIYRGIHFSQWHWPTEKCWHCGSNLGKRHGT
jgi:hypothetical protein